MARQLTTVASDQITNKRIKANYTFTLNGLDASAYLKTWSVSVSKDFGSTSASFVLDNSSGIFGDDGINQVNVGDVIELFESFDGDSYVYKRFYGKVEQRAITKNPTSREITLTCLDYLSVLQKWDINLTVEGTKFEIKDETLTPSFLTAPNDMFAQIYNFKNNAIAQEPKPILMVRDRLHLTDDPQFDGFDVIYDTGQVKFGSPLNARDNHEVVARSYFFYAKGVYIEDVLEALLVAPNGYGEYLFDELTADDVISNHLLSTFSEEEGGSIDFLTPNYTDSEIVIDHILSTATVGGETVIYLDSVEGLPSSGSAEIAGDIFTWSSIGSGNTLLGIPSTGENSLTAHPAGSYVKYTGIYAPGRVWYMTYNNIQTFNVNWWNPNWAYRLRISIDKFKIDDGLTNFPVLVRLNASNFNFSKGMANGHDIRFVDSLGHELSFERERHDSVNRLAEYHVKLPTVSRTQDTVFYLYYGNNLATNTEDTWNVWDSNYLAVYHLDETEGAVAGEVRDSTRNLKHGQGGLGTLANTPTRVTTTEGLGQQFDADNDVIGLLNCSDVQDSFTVETFATPNGMAAASSAIRNRAITGWRTSADSRWSLGVDNKFFAVGGSGTTWNSTTQLVDGTNYLLTMQYDHLNTRVYGLLNGQLLLNNIHTLTGTYNGVIRAGIFDEGQATAALRRAWAGSINEIRISSGLRSASWLKATHHSLNGTLVTVSPDTLFTTPGAEVDFIDMRYGRIILTTPISITSTVTCNTDYEFKTLQASGIEINKISFRERELDSRFDAIKKLREYVAPNYIIRTQGDNRIWSSFMSQKLSADYTLSLIKDINYLEDEDMYSRVVFFGKNKNPTNIMFDSNVTFLENPLPFKSFASQNQLAYETTENGKHIFKSTVTDMGYILTDFFTPVVYINGVPIDDQMHHMEGMPTAIITHTRTTEQGGSAGFMGTGVQPPEYRTYYYYSIHLGHQSVDPGQEIELYDAYGNTIIVIPPNATGMDYGRGIYDVPGTEQSSVVESVSTASYWVHYSTSLLEIDYDTVRFKISQVLMPEVTGYLVVADYEYFTVFTPPRGVAAVFDGRWDTQVQTEFFSDPPSGLQYATLDLGQVRDIQAIDIIGGFYRPDEYRKYDTDVRISLKYSVDNVAYYDISDETNNLTITGGQAIQLNEDQLGDSLRARYIQLCLQNVKKIDFGNGVWPVCITEVSIYGDVYIKSEAKLIYTCTSESVITSASTTILVDTTEGFDDPESGVPVTAYIGVGGASFTYMSKSGNAFYGCDVSSGVSVSEGVKIYKEEETETTVYDDDNLLNKYGDRLYKENKIDDELLFNQEDLDYLSKAWLREFYKDHTKATTNVLFTPYLRLGQTVALTDPYNNKLATRYFVEKITDSNGQYELTLARYPV